MQQNPNEPEQINVNNYVEEREYKAGNVLEALIKDSDYTFKKPKSKVEEYSKIARDIIIVIGVLISVGFILNFCWNVISSKDASADDKKWAQSTITFIVGAGLGYVAGTQQKTND